MRQGVFFMVIILILVLAGCQTEKFDLTGEMLFARSIMKNTESGIILYNTKTKEFKNIYRGSFLALSFNQDKTKILGYKGIDKEKGDYTVIFEYDIKNDKINPLIEYNNLREGMKYCLRYVPNKTMISYIWNNKIYIYDTVKKREIYYIEVFDDHYSWDNQGNNLLFNDRDSNIYLYNLKDNTKEQILKGRFPVYSNNNQYIAYMGTDHKLTVYDIKTKQEWKTEFLSGGSEEFKFSPDDKYLALTKQGTTLTNTTTYKFYILDYKTGNKMKLFEGDGGIPEFDWK